MDSKNILCFVCTKLQKPPEVHTSRLEYPLNDSIMCQALIKLVNVK